MCQVAILLDICNDWETVISRSKQAWLCLSDVILNMSLHLSQALTVFDFVEEEALLHYRLYTFSY